MSAFTITGIPFTPRVNDVSSNRGIVTLTALHGSTDPPSPTEQSPCSQQLEVATRLPPLPSTLTPLSPLPSTSTQPSINEQRMELQQKIAQDNDKCARFGHTVSDFLRRVPDKKRPDVMIKVIQLIAENYDSA
ncbi:uncharacterized protein LOC115052351 [Scomber scombrus]|uniref:Uncharacterized protein LOC115052351 n=1 Tax=Scomber scombrus TaxID=13677 RepID=A0AAV1QDA0_SCOSC